MLWGSSAIHAEGLERSKPSEFTAFSESSDTILAPKKKKGFVDRLPQPFRWIIRNWAATDERYAISSFYNWALQVQNSTTFEWVNMQMPQGVASRSWQRVPWSAVP